MAFAVYLRPLIAKHMHKNYVDLARTRLHAPLRPMHTAHASTTSTLSTFQTKGYTSRAASCALGQAIGPMDLSSAICNKTRAIHSSSYSEFRPSHQLMMPVRRRRRGTSRKIEPRDEEPSLDESDGTTTLERFHSPVTDSYEFDQASSRLLDKIEKAMEPMKLCNETFITKREDGELGEIYTIDLGPTIGVYQIEISQDEHVFEYRSPVSGNLLYCLSSATKEWINMEDGHAFEGILVRDLLRSNCIGLPKL